VLDQDDVLAAIVERTPLRRVAEPHEIAAVVVFLCQPPSSRGGRLPSTAACRFTSFGHVCEISDRSGFVPRPARDAFTF
jgi:NAD(P)-dependent dehydrogenase (short-subunit alcohol dehydrogenase family)